MNVNQILFAIADEIPGASKDILGGKGYGLNQMMLSGVPVPPGYIITTEACREYMQDPEMMMALIKKEVIPTIKKGLTKEFGYMPLVSVRSGAKFSMPGMMDTILNVGLTPDNAGVVWSKRLPGKCVEDSLKRLIEMYGSVVNGIERKKFEGRTSAERWVFYKAEVGEEFPDADEQLYGAIEAVFKSWNNDRAKTYRKLNKLSNDLGTAVVVQAMVFGNMNDKSGTGVAFSRDYSTGENVLVGDWLINGQGEDVVAGIRNTTPLSQMAIDLPSVATKLFKIIAALEKKERDMVDVEFTVQDGELYILQVRAGKRTAQAAVKIACDMVDEGMISIDEGIARVTFKQFLAASRPSIPLPWKAKNPAHGVGIPASNGCASGVAVFSSTSAVNCKEPCILIAEETTPDDIAGMNAAMGILTSTGGATSHAAVVARGMDKVCVVGCTDLSRSSGKWFLKGKVSKVITEGTKITIDGSTGEIWIDAEVPVEGGAGNGLSSKMMGLLEAKYGYYRTVTTLDELNGAKRILLATYLLDRNHGANLEKVAHDMFSALGNREVVIDLRSVQAVVREADSPIEFMWGAFHKESEVVDLKIKALIEAKPKKVKVLGIGLQADQITTLKEHGFEVIPHVTSISNLLDVNGVCMPDFDKLEKAAPEKDILKIVSLKKKAGEEIRSFNIVGEIDVDQFGRNALFALSGVQAAQSLLPTTEGE